MPTFDNLEGLASVRAKINDGIQNAETALGRLDTVEPTVVNHETRIQTLEAGGGGGTTNLAWDAGTSTVTSDTGTDATLSLVDGSNPGLMSVADKTKLNAISGTNTGDQTSIVGITGTKAQFDTAVTDGNFMYIGDAPTAHTHLLASGATDVTITATNLNTLDDGANTTLHFHDADRARANHTGTQTASTISDFTEAAQDAVGGALDATLSYNDGSNSIGRAALTGHITASAGSNVTALGSFTKAQLDAAVSDGNVLYVGDVTTNANHTGDATGATALTLATVNSNTGSFGSATQVATFTVNGKGLTTAAGNTSISIPSSQVNDFNSASRAQTEAELVAGTNVTITPSGSGATRQLTIAASGGGGGGQSPIAKEHFVTWHPQGNSTTVVNLGLSPSFTGTATTQNVATTSFYTMCKRIGYLVTTAATNAVANWRAAPQMWTVGGPREGEGGFTMTLRFGCSTGVATATTRLFAGLRTDGNIGSDVDPSSLANIVAFGWDNGDTNCQMMHNDASGTATKIDLGSSFARPSVNNTDVFEVTLSAASGTTQSIDYEIKRMNTGATATGTITTDLPSTSTFGSPHIYYSVGGTSSVIGLSIMKVTMESST